MKVMDVGNGCSNGWGCSWPNLGFSWFSILWNVEKGGKERNLRHRGESLRIYYGFPIDSSFLVYTSS